MAGFLDREYQISKIAILIEESTNGFSTEFKQKDTASPCLYINWAYTIHLYIKIIDRQDACPKVFICNTRLLRHYIPRNDGKIDSRLRGNDIKRRLYVFIYMYLKISRIEFL